MIKISKIDWLGAYRLKFYFSDTSAGEWDFAALVAQTGPMVEPLKDVDYFRRVFLEFGAPTWPNGFDIAPGWLHRELRDAGALSRQSVA